MEFRIIPLPDITLFYERFKSWVSAGYHGEMSYLSRGIEKRRSYPLWAKSILITRSFYNDFSWENVERENRALISKYAVRQDYHITLKDKIAKEIERIESHHKSLVYQIFVDSSAVMEKPLGYLSGFGFIGMNTILVDRVMGSYSNLGGAFLSIPPLNDFEVVESDFCKDCNLCVKNCPTGAILPERVLDARRCISYLTIEYKGVIEANLAKKMGSWVFGCDICQEVCPFNNKDTGEVSASLLRENLIAPNFNFLIELNEEKFKSLFDFTPVRRIGFVRFMRNVVIAAYNNGLDEILKNVIRKFGSDIPDLIKAQLRELTYEYGN